MIVDIKKVIIKDRIRKDFGNIQELAEDIKANGLINPPVVNKEYELLAGERRLRACKELGWKQIEVRMMDTRDAEHELNVEISENDVRKGFTKSERVDYMKRLLRIEQAKAKERMPRSGGNISTPQGKSRDITAEQFGISGKTMEKEISIVDNKDLLDPADFADWDEGKLSTNKTFQRVKAELDKAKRQHIIDTERIKVLEKTEPEVITKEIEVTPDDYEELKANSKRIDGYKKDFVDMRNRYEEMAEKWKKSETEKHELQSKLTEPEEKRKLDLKRDCIFFCAGVKNFLGEYGGYTYLKEEIDSLPDYERRSYYSAINAIREWSDSMLGEITIGD